MDIQLIELILSIIASVFSIIATIIAWAVHKDVDDVKRMLVARQEASGSGNTQIAGSGNKIGAE